MKKQAVVKRAGKLASVAINQMKQAGTFQRALEALELPIAPPGQFWRPHREAILWFREFVQHGGLILDPKYWALESGAVAAVQSAVELALMSGMDPIRAATQFIHAGPANEVIYTQVYPEDYEKVQKLFTALILQAFRGGNGEI